MNPNPSCTIVESEVDPEELRRALELLHGTDVRLFGALEQLSAPLRMAVKDVAIGLVESATEPALRARWHGVLSYLVDEPKHALEEALFALAGQPAILWANAWWCIERLGRVCAARGDSIGAERCITMCLHVVDALDGGEAERKLTLIEVGISLSPPAQQLREIEERIGDVLLAIEGEGSEQRHLRYRAELLLAHVAALNGNRGEFERVRSHLAQSIESERDVVVRDLVRDRLANTAMVLASARR